MRESQRAADGIMRRVSTGIADLMTPGKESWAVKSAMDALMSHVRGIGELTELGGRVADVANGLLKPFEPGVFSGFTSVMDEMVRDSHGPYQPG